MSSAALPADTRRFRAAREAEWRRLEEIVVRAEKGSLRKLPDEDLLAKRVTTRIECAKYFHQRDEALLAHATQIDPKSFFFTTPMEWQQRLWPTEEFELARSRVPVSLPETDLFTGIEGRS